MFAAKPLIGAPVHSLGLAPITAFQDTTRPAHRVADAICPPCCTIPRLFALRGIGQLVAMTAGEDCPAVDDGETKGDQLDNLDTAYKRNVLGFLSDNFAWDGFIPAGQLELVQNNGETVDGTLILMSEWRAKLPEYLKA